MCWHTKSPRPELRPDSTRPLHLGVRVTGDNGTRARREVCRYHHQSFLRAMLQSTATQEQSYTYSINTATILYLRQFTFAPVAACPSGPKGVA